MGYNVTQQVIASHVVDGQMAAVRENMPGLSTLQALVQALGVHGDRTAVVALHQDGSESWSYAEIATHVQRLAHGLAAVGVGRGTPVVLLAENRPAWIVACLAVLTAGAVVVPLDGQFDDAVLRHVLHDSGARSIFTTTPMAHRLERLAP